MQSYLSSSRDPFPTSSYNPIDKAAHVVIPCTMNDDCRKARVIHDSQQIDCDGLLVVNVCLHPLLAYDFNAKDVKLLSNITLYERTTYSIKVLIVIIEVTRAFIYNLYYYSIT